MNSKKEAKKIIQRSYLNKDMDDFKGELLKHARTFYRDSNADFSESSLGGLFLELAAFVGDTNSFYLDHQFGELDPELAVESENIEAHLRNAGVKITGAASAVSLQSFAIEVPVVAGTSDPDPTLLPTILQGTILESDSGVSFELTEDLDFSSTKSNGELKAKKTIGEKDQSGNVSSVILTMGGPDLAPVAPEGVCISGARAIATYKIPNELVPFREITLPDRDITEIISVVDSDDNEYYNVENLSQDTVFQKVRNNDSDNDLVEDSLVILPAPYRYTDSVDLDTRLTTIRFGTGDALTFSDNIIPDPSELALPLYGKRQFSRFTLDPGKLLATQTLGIAPRNTTITVTYRHGGGLLHNINEGSINTVTTLRMTFPGNPDAALAASVRASLSTINLDKAVGGEEAPTIDDLRELIGPARNAQSRIVDKRDLLARIYNMPSNFGRVFRAGVKTNPNNPLASQVFLVSRDIDKKLILSPDTLKKNLRTYLNEFRLTSDSIDILDMQVVNFSVEFTVVVNNNTIKSLVLQDIISRLKRYLRVENFQMDQPIIIGDLRNLIFNSPGVQTVADLTIKNLQGNILDREYSGVKFDIENNIKNDKVIGPPGSIFELKFPNFDIIGSAI